jgi:dolichol-phosphate mannosyltransferase
MISVIIPCHNESAVLPELFDRVLAAAGDWHDDWEVLFVDDGSTDDTWGHVQRLHAHDPRWKGVRLTRNFGHQAAIGAGLEHARGDVVAIMDADLQDPPEQIVHMLEKWHEGYDIVYGIRTQRPEGWLKRAAYALFYRLLGRTSVVELPHDAGDFGVLDRRVVDVLCACQEQHPFWRGLRAWTGFRQIGMPYRRQPRQAGVSQYTFAKLCKLALDGWMCLSEAPVRLLAWIGGAAVAVTLLLGLWLLLAPDQAMIPALWLAVVFGGLQLLALAVIGQYVHRIYEEALRRPRWLVAEAIGLQLGGESQSGVRHSMTRRNCSPTLPGKRLSS